MLMRVAIVVVLCLVELGAGVYFLSIDVLPYWLQANIAWAIGALIANIVAAFAFYNP